MRLKFKKFKQRELIINYKKKHRLTWRKLAKSLKVKEGTLRNSWYYEKTLMPCKIYDKLDKNRIYADYILKRYSENWGRSKGGLNSKGNTKDIEIPRFSKELAELVGIILGDGNIHEFQKGKKIRTYMLRIVGDSNKDRDYLSKYVYTLCKDLFRIEPKFYFSKRSKAIYLIIHSKRLVDFLKSVGLSSGDKIVNQITIPNWILKNKIFLKVCLRGLIDTDGSIYRMSRKNPYLLRISFKNHDKALLSTTRDAFIDLGFHPSKIIGSEVFVISRQRDISKYLKEIGFSNNKHNERLKKFCSPSTNAPY